MTSRSGYIPGYTELRPIGGGGSATVYRARQPAFDREVAIKVLAGKPDDAARVRFARECSALGALSGHPNIVTLYDMGCDDDGRMYVVMELLTGGSLADLLDREGPLYWPATVELGVKLAGALESAHRSGVLHGDVKPENILLSRFGEPKLADFGLAGTAQDGGSPGGVVATLAHAAPEVAAGGRPTAAGDVYGLASTLHTLISGRPPFARAGDLSLVTLVARLSTEPPPDLRRLGVPDQLSGILEQAMAKDPADRQSDGARLGRQLQAFQASSGLPITPMVLESETSVEPPPPLTEDDPARPARTFAPRWALGARLLGVLLVAAAAIAWFLPGRRATIRLSQVYQDNFDAGQGWYEHDDPLIALAYDEGQYRLAVKQPRHQVVSDTAFRGPVYGTPLVNLGDVSVRVTARASSNSGFLGIVCRQAPGAGRYYEGLVSVDGTARIVKSDGGRLVTLATAPVALTGDTPTRLRLDCLGGPDDTRLRLFANNRKLVDVGDREGVGPGSAGLVLASGDAASAEARFDDFVILGRRTDVR